MKFEEWIKQSFPNKGNNDHSLYSVKDMHSAFYAGIMHGTGEEAQKEEKRIVNPPAGEQKNLPSGFFLSARVSCFTAVSHSAKTVPLQIFSREICLLYLFYVQSFYSIFTHKKKQA